MRVLITGATGFIASQFVATLHEAGHEIVCCVRNVKQAEERFWYADVIPCDFNKDTDEKIWVERLTEHRIDAVINVVGVFQGSFKQSIEAIHTLTPIALFKACQQANVKRVIHISALGAGDVVTPYGESKNAADEYLLGLEKVSRLVIRPSVVYSSGSYGGTSLFRGLSAIPFIIPLVGKGEQKMAPIFLPELAKAVEYYLTHPEVSGKIIYAVGPEEVSLKKMLIGFRRWLGLPKARCLSIPKWLIAIPAKIGDWLERSPLNSTAMKMMDVNNVADPQPFMDSLPFKVKGFTDVLSTLPSSTQDRWHAKLYFIRPLLRFALAFVWIVSGIIPLFDVTTSVSLLAQAGMPESMLVTTTMVLSFIDIVIGLLVLLRWQIYRLGAIQLLFVLGYTLIITITMPHLWLDPFGAIIKNIPILVVILVWMAIEDDR